jgi:aldehyde dehydrogenase (NAD+)
MYHEAGFPKGVFNLIHGEGGAGKFLVQQDVDHICFTGSVWAGRDVRKECARSWHKTSSCEMGSKSACIVFDDANFNLALEACVASAYKLSGQRCVSSGRMIVQRGIYDKFVERFVEASKNVVIGAPIKSELFDQKVTINDITYGPIINQRGYDKVVHFNSLAEQSPDTEMLLKGEKIGDKGWFLSPTVYKTPWVPNSEGSAYLRDEVFGPHVSLIPFDHVDDAIRIYNDTEYGLALGILTEDFHKARYCRDRCDFGMGYWNGGSIAAESHLSFGGVKKSGNGYPSAARTFRAVTHEISWTVNHGEEMVFPQGMDK